MRPCMDDKAYNFLVGFELHVDQHSKGRCRLEASRIPKWFDSIIVYKLEDFSIDFIISEKICFHSFFFWNFQNSSNVFTRMIPPMSPAASKSITSTIGFNEMQCPKRNDFRFFALSSEKLSGFASTKRPFHPNFASK